MRRGSDASEEGNPSGPGWYGSSDEVTQADFAPTVEFPAVRRERRGLHRIVAVIVALAIVGGILFFRTPQQRP